MQLKDLSGIVTSRIKAQNQDGGEISEARTIYYESNKSLIPLYHVPGDIVDFDGQRILYTQDDNAVFLKNISTGMERKGSESATAPHVEGSLLLHFLYIDEVILSFN